MLSFTDQGVAISVQKLFACGNHDAILHYVLLDLPFNIRKNMSVHRDVIFWKDWNLAVVGLQHILTVTQKIMYNDLDLCTHCKYLLDYLHNISIDMMCSQFKKVDCSDIHTMIKQLQL